jgi:Tfp pilus assembly protein PilN
MKTRFNLATEPLENNRRFIAGSGLLGIIALVGLLLLSLHVVQMRRSNATMRAEINRVQSQIAGLQQQQEVLRQQFKAPQAVEAMKRSQFLNGLIEQRAFPWTKMFADLGHILPPGVRVISISPEMDKGGKVKVTFTIGAVNEEQGNKFLQAISSSPLFSDVVPMQESRGKNDQDQASEEVLLNLEAHYSTL